MSVYVCMRVCVYACMHVYMCMLVATNRFAKDTETVDSSVPEFLLQLRWLVGVAVRMAGMLGCWVGVMD